MAENEIYLRAYPVMYGIPPSYPVYKDADVNKERRQRKTMGMTGKQYRKWRKKQNKESDK